MTPSPLFRKGSKKEKKRVSTASVLVNYHKILELKTHPKIKRKGKEEYTKGRSLLFFYLIFSEPTKKKKVV
jgi:hypothetical protein